MTVPIGAEHALLRQLVVRLTKGAKTVGCGFAVAPDLVVTACHVWQEADCVETMDERELRVINEWTWQEKSWKRELADWPDLALLQVEDHLEHFAPLGSRLLSAGSLLRYCGLPSSGGTNVLTADNATLVALDGDEGEAFRFTQTLVQGGYSGGPLIDPETAQVVAVVVASKDPNQALGGFAISTEHLIVRWPKNLARPDDIGQRMVWGSVYARPGRVVPHRGRLAYRMGEFFFGFYAAIQKDNRTANEVSEFLILSEQLGIYHTVAILIESADAESEDLYDQLQHRIQMAMFYGGENLVPFFDIGQDMLAIRGSDAKTELKNRDISLARARNHLQSISRVQDSLPMHLAWDRLSAWWQSGRLSPDEIDTLLLLVHGYFLVFALPHDSAGARSAIGKMLAAEVEGPSDDEVSAVVAAASRAFD